LILGALSLKIATMNGHFSLPIAGIIMSVPIVDAFLAILRRFVDMNHRQMVITDIFIIAYANMVYQ
jgi:hypothetical protein